MLSACNSILPKPTVTSNILIHHLLHLHLTCAYKLVIGKNMQHVIFLWGPTCPTGFSYPSLLIVGMGKEICSTTLSRKISKSGSKRWLPDNIITASNWLNCAKVYKCCKLCYLRLLWGPICALLSPTCAHNSHNLGHMASGLLLSDYPCLISRTSDGIIRPVRKIGLCCVDRMVITKWCIPNHWHRCPNGHLRVDNMFGGNSGQQLCAISALCTNGS